MSACRCIVPGSSSLLKKGHLRRCARLPTSRQASHLPAGRQVCHLFEQTVSTGVFQQPARGAHARGVLLLEVMIVLVLVGVFGIVLYETVITGLRTVSAADDREEVRQQLTNALERLMREASVARDVGSAADHTFQFDADTDGNGMVETNIEYRLSSGALERSNSGTIVPLVRGVTALDFDYVDLNGSTMSTPVAVGLRDTIRVVQMTITATRDNETIALASAAFLRNQ